MNLLATPTRRKILFGALYASEGAPIGYLWWALPTRLRAEGVPIDSITLLTGTLVLPWAFKFLWAPLVDVVRGGRWSLRSWIVGSQLVMGLALLPLLRIDPATQFGLLFAVLWVHAFAAATQDVAIDALAIASSAPGERGAINGWMQVGMLTSRAVFGGGALMAGAWLGHDIVVVALVATIWSTTVLVLLARENAPDQALPASFRETVARFAGTLADVLVHPITRRALPLAVFGGMGWEAVGAVAGPFLIDRDLSEKQVGTILFAPVVLCMMTGALLGGYLSDRIGRRLAVGAFLGASVAAVLLIVLADLISPADVHAARIGSLVLLYLTIGLFTASSYALFMDLSDPRLRATQFSTFMGATNLCEAIAALAVGRLIAGLGYPPAFVIMAAVSLLALSSLKLIRPPSGGAPADR